MRMQLSHAKHLTRHTILRYAFEDPTQADACMEQWTNWIQHRAIRAINSEHQTNYYERKLEITSIISNWYYPGSGKRGKKLDSEMFLESEFQNERSIVMNWPVVEGLASPLLSRSRPFPAKEDSIFFYDRTNKVRRTKITTREQTEFQSSEDAYGLRFCPGRLRLAPDVDRYELRRGAPVRFPADEVHGHTRADRRRYLLLHETQLLLPPPKGKGTNSHISGTHGWQSTAPLSPRPAWRSRVVPRDLNRSLLLTPSGSPADDGAKRRGRRGAAAAAWSSARWGKRKCEGGLGLGFKNAAGRRNETAGRWRMGRGDRRPLTKIGRARRHGRGERDTYTWRRRVWVSRARNRTRKSPPPPPFLLSIGSKRIDYTAHRSRPHARTADGVQEKGDKCRGFIAFCLSKVRSLNSISLSWS